MGQLLQTAFFPAVQRESRRLLIMLHGLGDSLEGYRWLPEVLDLPWLNYLLVNAPDPYYGGYSWFDFLGDITPTVTRSRQLLFELLAEQHVQGFPADQTILSGFSQGCLMSIEVGLRYPSRLAGIVGVSGYICNPTTLIQELSPVAFQQRLLVTHGFMDPIVPFAVVRGQIELLKSAGLQVEWREFVKAHNIAGEAELDVIRDFIRAGYNGA
ncbi:MAG TPA: serine esterase [Bacillota bacterium]|nr:serine esterase [Bacillota bacterium]